MAERLTEVGMFIDTPVYKIKNGKKSEAVDKLAHLEDIMERLGINFVEDLEDEIKSLRVDKYIYKKDRDTWKRACELACEREDDCYVYDNIHRAYEFYQQAKNMDGNDE